LGAFEAQSHALLRRVLRARASESWPHHLTMARLVARALRSGRPAAVQAGSATAQYRIGYLVPALLWPGPIALVAPASIREQLLRHEIPALQQWLDAPKPVLTERPARSPTEEMLLRSPSSWLAECLSGERAAVPVIVDGAEDLERWARQQLRAGIRPADWEALVRAYPNRAERIRATQAQIERALARQAPRPSGARFVAPPEQAQLQALLQALGSPVSAIVQPAFRQFGQQWQASGELLWAQPEGEAFALYCEPGSVAPTLSTIWQQQPFALIGRYLDCDRNAANYRQQLGLGELTCVQFAPQRQSELLQLYCPPRLPRPNQPAFADCLLQELRYLVPLGDRGSGPTVVLIGDTPLRAQIGAQLAAEFGSRVRVDKTGEPPQGSSILVGDWAWWRSQREHVPPPPMLAIATLPLPSLEDPRAAAPVAYYKRHRQDWFRGYLLPNALRELQQGVMPVRQAQGAVALLDSRVQHRSYGRGVLAALEPCASVSYIDTLALASAGSSGS